MSLGIVRREGTALPVLSAYTPFMGARAVDTRRDLRAFLYRNGVDRLCARAQPLPALEYLAGYSESTRDIHLCRGRLCPLRLHSYRFF